MQSQHIFKVTCSLPRVPIPSSNQSYTQAAIYKNYPSLSDKNREKRKAFPLDSAVFYVLLFFRSLCMVFSVQDTVQYRIAALGI